MSDFGIYQSDSCSYSSSSSSSSPSQSSSQSLSSSTLNSMTDALSVGQEVRSRPNGPFSQLRDIIRSSRLHLGFDNSLPFASKRQDGILRTRIESFVIFGIEWVFEHEMNSFFFAFLIRKQDKLKELIDDVKAVQRLEHSEQKSGASTTTTTNINPTTSIAHGFDAMTNMCESALDNLLSATTTTTPVSAPQQPSASRQPIRLVTKKPTGSLLKLKQDMIRLLQVDTSAPPPAPPPPSERQDARSSLDELNEKDARLSRSINANISFLQRMLPPSAANEARNTHTVSTTNITNTTTTTTLTQAQTKRKLNLYSTGSSVNTSPIGVPGMMPLVSGQLVSAALTSEGISASGSGNDGGGDVEQQKKKKLSKKKAATTTSKRANNALKKDLSLLAMDKIIVKRSTEIQQQQQQQQQQSQSHSNMFNRELNRYICVECGRRAKKLSALKRHLLSHTSLRPYTCTYCDKSFGTKGNLGKHLKTKAHVTCCMRMGMQANDALITRITSENVDDAALKSQIEINNKVCVARQTLSPITDTTTTKQPSWLYATNSSYYFNQSCTFLWCGVSFFYNKYSSVMRYIYNLIYLHVVANFNPYICNQLYNTYTWNISVRFCCCCCCYWISANWFSLSSSFCFFCHVFIIGLLLLLLLFLLFFLFLFVLALTEKKILK